MNRLDIYYSIRKAGYTQAAIAKKLKVERSVVGDIVAGRRRSKRVAKEISTIVGVPVSKLWPGQYPVVELEECMQRSAA